MQDIQPTIEQYKKKGMILEHPIVIRTGKEAVVYRVRVSESTDAALKDKLAALKVYKDPEQRSFQKNETYLEGKFYTRPSVRNAISKGNQFAKKFLYNSWVKREYSLLQHLNKKGAVVPQVYSFAASSVLMEFIGDEEVTAPRLIDAELELSDARAAFDAIIDTTKKFLSLGVVHADLSPYNILWWEHTPYIIDFPQTIDVKQNPNVEQLLRRDVDNVAMYFKKYFTIDTEVVYQDVLKSRVDQK